MNEKKLTTERAFLLTVLADYIHEKPTDVPKDMDFAAFAQLSDAQQVSPIVYYQTRLPSLQSGFAHASYYAINRSRLLEALDREFHSADVQYLVFKGMEIARYYRHPQLRTSGDIDIMVRDTQKEKAGEILQRLGFHESERKGTDHEWTYGKRGFEIELHHRLLYDGTMTGKVRTSFTDTAWEHASTADGTAFHLEPEFHFVFLLLHLRKHFLWAGAGIRQFMDLALMMANTQMDWQKVGAYIKCCEIEGFAAVCFALVARWFSVPARLPQAELSEESFLKATNTVLSGSVFGDMSSENRAENGIINTVNHNGKLRSALAILFPPYAQMEKKYPGLSGHDAIGRILLPVFWILRILQSAVHHTAKDGVFYAKRHLTGDRARELELKEWGLM